MVTKHGQQHATEMMASSCVAAPALLVGLIHEHCYVWVMHSECYFSPIESLSVERWCYSLLPLKVTHPVPTFPNVCRSPRSWQ